MRRLAIATVLCALGILAYLHWSECPARVHWMTLPTHVIYLLAISAAAWLWKLGWKQRLVVGVGLTVIAAVVGSYLDGRVIAALTQFHPIYLILAALTFLFEGALLLLATWLIDHALRSLSPHLAKAE